MNCTVVNFRIARRGSIQDALDGFVLCEHIKAKGAEPIVDPLNHGLDRFDFEHPQDRPENFLLHDR